MSSGSAPACRYADVYPAQSVPDVQEQSLRALLAQHPEAVVATLGYDGHRVPVPPALGLDPAQCLPVPGNRATMVDLVVPADAMKVITAFERATFTGAGVCMVRTRSHPDHSLRLTIMDLRAGYGVFVGLLTDDAVTPRLESGSALAASLTIPSRPRTATLTKTWRAMVAGIDERVTTMLGWTAQDMLGRRSLDFYHPDDHERAIANWMELLSTRASQRVRLRHRTGDGMWLWVEIEHVYQTADDLEDVTVVAHLSDISTEMAAHEAVDRRERLFRRLAESLPLGLLQIARDGSVTYANSRLPRILGAPGAASLDVLLGGVVAGDRRALDEAVSLALRGGPDQEFEIEMRSPDGGRRRCHVNLIALGDDESESGALACVTDVTDGARMREELRHKATFDALTGCYNRASILAMLDGELAGVGDGGLAVIFVDLDRFKPINDRLGHAVGDELLIRVASAIGGALRSADAVGRIGGDEFLVVCPSAGTAAEAMAVAERVRRALERPVEVSTGTVRIGASLGVAYTDGAVSGELLVARADEAMYRAKHAGTGRPVLYDPDACVPDDPDAA